MTLLRSARNNSVTCHKFPPNITYIRSTPFLPKDEGVGTVGKVLFTGLNFLKLTGRPVSDKKNAARALCLSLFRPAHVTSQYTCCVWPIGCPHLRAHAFPSLLTVNVAQLDWWRGRDRAWLGAMVANRVRHANRI